MATDHVFGYIPQIGDDGYVSTQINMIVIEYSLQTNKDFVINKYFYTVIL